MPEDITAPPDQEVPEPDTGPNADAERARAVDTAAAAPGLDEVLRDLGTTLTRVGERVNELVALAQRLETRQRVDLAVRLARAGDVAGATDAVEQVLGQRGVRDVGEAVAEVRRTRPGLFRPSSAVSVLSGAGGPAAGPTPPATADRRTLLEYMRARRG